MKQTIRTHTTSIGGIEAQRPLTPRETALMKLAIETAMRKATAMTLGMAVTHERAHAEALAMMSERERALVAKDVTPNGEASA